MPSRDRTRPESLSDTSYRVVPIWEGIVVQAVRNITLDRADEEIT